MSKLVEEWRPVVGYEGLYEVSDWGRVRSVDKIVEYSNGVKHPYAGKLMVLSLSKDGYFTVILHKNNKVKNSKVHRLVAEAILNLEKKYFNIL